MEPQYIIYGLEDPNTKEIRYIGLSSSGLKRPRAHFCKSHLSRKTHRSSWIKSLNGVYPKIVILEESQNKDDLPALEIKWIRTAKSSGWDLTNHTDGGEGTNSFKHTDESKRKMSEASKKMWKENPVVFTEEARFKCGSSNRGKKLGSEWSQRCASLKNTPEFKVYNSKSGELVGKWRNISECSRSLDISRRTISDCLNHGRINRKFKFEKVML